MLFKTKGICLSYIKFKETSIIVRIYTRSFGLQSYIVNGLRSTKSKKTLGFFQPLTLLDLVAYHRKETDINRLSEFKIGDTYTTIPFDVRKMSMAIFLSEFMTRVLKEEEEQAEQFDFLYNSLLVLDELDSGYENFHLQLIIKLSRYLGHGLSSARELTAQADTQSSNNKIDAFVDNLIHSNYNEHLDATGAIRSETLELLMGYFENQYDHWSEMKSLKVLGQIFH
ncbi:MAG: DNA repair protein RecO [Cyclobacteriaceae bacterium]